MCNSAPWPVCALSVLLSLYVGFLVGAAHPAALPRTASLAAAVAAPAPAPAPAPAAEPFRAFEDCAPLDWASAPAAAAPELLLRSGVFSGSAALNFTLAAPSAQSSWISHFWGEGMWAPVETLVFLRVLGARSPGGVVVDVGVNLGYFSQLALSLGAAAVVGFEPQPRARPYLAASARLSAGAARRWALFPCAIGSKRGHVSMTAPEKWGLAQVDYVDGSKVAHPADSDFGGSDGARTQSVPMVRLSDIVPSAPVRLLKVDTEGFEVEVFKGVAAELLARTENVVAEVKTREGRVWLQALLAGAGFACRQYKEEYGVFIPTKGLAQRGVSELLSAKLLACDEEGGGAEDFWFSRRDHP